MPTRWRIAVTSNLIGEVASIGWKLLIPVRDGFLVGVMRSRDLSISSIKSVQIEDPFEAVINLVKDDDESCVLP